jgi:mono/diheme cytochrome c family protein
MSFLANSAKPFSAFRGSIYVATVALLFLAGSAKPLEKIIKKAPITQTDASSGQAMFTSYCAACRGPAGKGDGPAASELKVKPCGVDAARQEQSWPIPFRSRLGDSSFWH